MKQMRPFMSNQGLEPEESGLYEVPPVKDSNSSEEPEEENPDISPE